MNELAEISPNNSWPVEPCMEGWEYDTTQVTSSIVTDVSIQECGTATEHYRTLSTCNLLLMFILHVTLFFNMWFNSVILTSGIV
jgi:hypothetical protein